MEKIKHNRFSKVLVLLMAVMMVLTMMPNGMWGGAETAWAAGGEKAEVYLSFYHGGYVIPKQKVEVSSTLSDQYEYEDVGTGVSALDVLIKAHEILYRNQKGKQDPNLEHFASWLKEALKVSSGSISASFGNNDQNLSLAVNGEMAADKSKTYPASPGYPESYVGLNIPATPVQNDDYVEFLRYSDSTYYLDCYTYFTDSNGNRQSKVAVKAGETVELGYNGYEFMTYGLAVESSYRNYKENKHTIFDPEDSAVILINPLTGAKMGTKEIATVKADGGFTVSFSEPGTYIISTAFDEDAPAFAPWFEVNVTADEDYYAATERVAYVTVKDASKAYIQAQKLSVGWFDITQFMSGDTSNYKPSTEVTAANSLIEAIYYSIYKADPNYQDLQDAAKVAEVKKHLSFSDAAASWAGESDVTINQIFQNDKLVTFSVNDAFAPTSMGTTNLQSEDNLVFYDWSTTDICTKVKEVQPSVTKYGNDTYVNFEVRLYAYTSSYETGETALEGAAVTATNYYEGAGFTSPWKYIDNLTNASGNTSLQISPNPINRNGANSLMLEISKVGMQSDFVRIDYNFDGTNISGIHVNKVVSADTGIKKFEVSLDEGSTYSDLTQQIKTTNLPYDVSDGITNVKLRINANDENALILVGDSSIENKGTVEVNTFALQEGSNVFSFKIKNGTEEETYTFTIRRTNGTYDVDEAVRAVLNTVTDINADFILAKHEAGIAVTDEEKAAFLKSVLSRSNMTYTPGSEAKMVMALAALDIDATKVPNITSDTLDNLVSEIYNADLSKVSAVTQIPYILYVTDSGLYDAGADAARTKVIAALKTANWGAYGMDSKAMIAQAVAPYYLHASTGYKNISKEDCEAIKTKVDDFLSDAKSSYIQQANGTYGNNSNTTATVVEALAALKQDATNYKQNGGKDVVSALFLFQNIDKTFGYTGTAYNEFSSKAVVNALLAFKEYLNNGAKDICGSVYDITGQVNVLAESEWPQVETGLIAVPSKTTYTVAESISADDLQVKVIYNSRPATAKVVAYDLTGTNGYKLDYNFGSAGTQKVKVTYKGLDTNYNVTVASDSTLPTATTVTFRITGLSKNISESNYAIANGESVMDVLKAILNKNNISVTIRNGNYVASIDGLGEFDKGPNSGWMVRVDGKLIEVSAAAYKLNGGETIEWFYTKDWTTVPGAMDFMKSETKSDVITSGASGSATTTAPTDVKVSEKTNADGTKETVAAVKVDSKHHDEIIKQAAEKKSAEIVLEVSKADSKGADNVQLTLDVTFVKNVADKTNADLTVNTENGKVSLDQETLKTVLSAAKGATITLEISKVAKPTEAQKKAAGANGHVISLTVKSGNQIISDFNKGKATVMVELVSRLLGKKVAAIHIADDGTIEQLAGKLLTIGGKQYYEFATPHFSTFAIVDADEVGLDAAEEPTVDAKALVSKLTPAARSAKTAKKNVKVTTRLDKQDKEIISQLKDAGYTVKYRFYRSTKKAAGYKAAVTKKASTYTSTSGKKGTKYFYKVQVRVYDASGKLAAKTALKQCRCASRTWSK